MRRPALVTAAAAAALLSVSAFVSLARGADPAPTRVAAIDDVMLTVNNGDESIVSRLRAQFNQASLDDEGWELARARATMIIEAGNLLWDMKPPLGNDAAGIETWHKHVMDYRGCGEAAREATTKKDLAAGKAAMQSIAKRCLECHKDHRKDE